MKQLCRMMTLPNEDSFSLVGYWLGSFLWETRLGESFPQFAEAGPVSHLLTRHFPLHQYLLETFLESVGRGEIKNSTMKLVTTKEIYKSRISSLLTPPKIEAKFPLVNFPQLVYPRINHPVLETRQRDILYTMTHGLYKNRERHRADDPLCPNQAYKISGLVQSVEHIACACFRVKMAWLWVREKVVELLSDQRPVPAVTNTELIMLTYPRCRREAEAAFLLGNYIELVDTEATAKLRGLMVGTVKGVLRTKFGHMTSRPAPEIHLRWDSGKSGRGRNKMQHLVKISLKKKTIFSNQKPN